MPSTVFAAPLLPGKTGARKEAVAEISGARKEEYLRARRDLGATKETVCLQQTPHGDFVVVYIEANDTSKILQDMLVRNDAFHTWFNQAVLKDCHGIESAGMVPPANEVFLDLI